jgi:hypothetical protein
MEAYMAQTNAGGKLLPLHDLKNVNTVIGMLYDEKGVYRAGFDPNVFYNTILIDSLKYGEENYVHLSAAETLTIRRGDTTARFRRWAGLTPTLSPLKEGIPPSPDKHAYETIEVGNVFSFGRWSEYTDKIDLSIVNEVIAERSVQYGEVANQTKELYARKTWLATPNEFFAGFKGGFANLQFGDEVTLDDLRFLVARMKRMMVKPVGGKFNYVCSAEFINGLIDDPRVKQYMEIEQTTGKLFTSGQVFDMFELSFIPTMLDEFAYPDIEFPGVYETAAGVEVIRLYAIRSGVFYYLDVHQDFAVKVGVTAKTNVAGTTYLKDGSAIEELVKWEMPLDAADLVTGSIQGTGEATATRCTLRKSTRTRTTGSFGEIVTTYSPLADATGDVALFNTMIDGGEFTQLPVHRGILFGAEALVKLVMEGVSDSPKIIIKSLGSSGVADPIDQRQSIGFKVDGFGLAIKRPEAVVVTFGIPKHAELAALSNQVVFAPYQPSFLADAENDANLSHINAAGAQTLRVDGVNLSGKPGSPNVAGFNDYPKFLQANAYVAGNIVNYNNEIFIFTAAKAAAAAWDATKVKRYVDTLERDVFEDSVENQEISVQGNSKKSNVK